MKNNYMVVTTVALCSSAFIDFLHTLAYYGMNVFIGYDANLPTQLWIASRALQAVSMLYAAYSIDKKINPKYFTAVHFIVTGALLSSIFVFDLFPVSYVQGVGLTPFKIYMEYLISVVLLASIYLLDKKSKHFDERVHAWIKLYLGLTIVSELAFTFYVGVYGVSNLIGHIFKFIAFYLIYKAIIESAVKRPIDLIFYELKQSEEIRAHMERARIRAEIQAQQNIELSAREGYRKGMEYAGKEARNKIIIISQAIELYNQEELTHDEFLDIVKRNTHQASDLLDGITDLVEKSKIR